jgi:succinate dehydrogenase / fumarate reductase iron-sulfur subunit
MHCIEKCPKSVKPMERIIELRTEAMRQGIVDNNGSRHAIGFEQIIKESGWLDENKLAMMSTGSLSEKLRLLPVGIQMLIKGKMPSPLHKPLKSIKAIKKIAKQINATEGD